MPRDFSAARRVARAQLARAELADVALPAGYLGAPARLLRLVLVRVLRGVERCEAIEKAAYKVAVRRCKARTKLPRFVAGGKFVPASWEDFWFRHLYSTTVRAGVAALGHAGVRADLKRGTLTPRDLVTLPAWDLLPAKWRRDVVVDAVKLESIPDGSVRCRKCGSKKTTWTSKQLRSADEPATAFFTCFACGRHWRSSA